MDTMPVTRATVRRLVTVCTLLACSSALVRATSKGPDGGGYTATDEAVFSFVDISGSSGGSRILSGMDDGTAVLKLSFPFTFYGHAYELACVSTNGAVYFVASPAGCTGFEADFANVDLTAASVPNNRAALLPFWMDLTFQVAGSGGIYYQTVGTAPARRFIVQWHNAYPQGAPNPVTFQVILHEEGQVRFQYKTVTLGGHLATNGGRATVGIRNANSPGNQQQLQWSFNAPVLADSTALLFASTDLIGPTLTATPSPARIWPPNNKPVSVSVTGTITDSGTGVDAATAGYTVTDEYGAVQPAGPIAVGTDGSYKVEFRLPAERRGDDKDGRLYTIVITARDLAGNQGSVRIVVLVPHDER